MTKKDKFLDLLGKHGYRSINNFCIENKLIQTNVNNRINKDIKVDLTTLFAWANILHEPIESLIEIFYQEELEENRNCIQ